MHKMHECPIVLDFLGLAEAKDAAAAQLAVREDELVSADLDALEDERLDDYLFEPQLVESEDAFEFLGHLEVMSHLE